MTNVIQYTTKKIAQFGYHYPKSAFVSAYILYALITGTGDYLRNVDRLPVYWHDMIYLTVLRDNMIQLFQDNVNDVHADARDTLYTNNLDAKEIELQLQPGHTSYSSLKSTNITTPFLRNHIGHCSRDVAELLRIKIPQRGE